MANTLKSHRTTSQSLLLGICLVLLPYEATAENTLQATISRLVHQPAFDPARTAVVAMRVDDGHELVAINPNLALNPASCAKIVTAAAALTLLGPDYRFTTHFFSDRRPDAAGNIGTLFIQGDGDPFLVSEQLWRMTRRLLHEGVQRIEGDLVIDNSFFDNVPYTTKQGDEGRAFTAKTSAVAINFNSAQVLVSPGANVGESARVSIEPATEYIRLINRVKTTKKENIVIQRQPSGDHETWTVSGTVPAGLKEPLSFYRSVENPVTYAGAIAREVLQQNGILLTGRVREGGVPSSAILLAKEPSKPLALIVRDMNKFSNNFVAEQITKHIGAAKKGTPGSTAKGVAVYHDYLNSLGISKQEAHIENGSGLSEASRISARALVRVLAASYRNFTTEADMVASFSILGVDGTMKRWSEDGLLRGKLRAKTGSLDGVASLAGYIPTASGDMTAFAILGNGLHRGGADVHDGQLKIVSTIAESR
ncbi:MAG: D-alanyl-D-alanine carboxypeptidase/D-alanyl-D-alanine-endopeptidase [Deltaproteobacteria bacterium]|nr:D-alanyl-D-alanine carboxypeptidase/D-alanyl-D-alanine-endopeptidase [Deltaproteobacteria bacterium]